MWIGIFDLTGSQIRFWRKKSLNEKVKMKGASSLRPFGKSIGIVGGGVGGLALAVGLQERLKSSADKIHIRAYDAGGRPTPPGVSLLGLNKGAFSSLRNISEKLASDVKAESEVLSQINLVDPNCTVLEEIASNESTGQVMAIPRDTLRSIFLRHIDPRFTEVSYTDRVVGVKNVVETREETGGGRGIEWLGVEIERESNKPAMRHDVVIGCDGLDSVVRKGLFARLQDQGIDKKNFLDLYGIAGVSRGHTDRLPVELHNSLTNVFSEREHAVLSLQCYKDLLYWHLVFHSDEKEEFGSAPSLRERALRVIGGWYHSFTKIIDTTPADNIRGMPLCDRDALTSLDMGRKNMQRTIVVGDALHPLCPFVGGFGEDTNISLAEVEQVCRLLEPFCHGQKEGAAFDNDLAEAQTSLAALGAPLLEQARSVALRIASSGGYVSHALVDHMQEKKEGL